MTIYKIVLDGEIILPENERTELRLPAGFITTRFFDTETLETAIEKAKASVLAELEETMGRLKKTDVRLVVESCYVYDTWPDIAPNKGFSFYLER